MNEDDTDLWQGDVNDAVIEDWKNDTTPFDRVKTVLETTTEPEDADEIAKRARVDVATAREVLSSLVKKGKAKRVSDGEKAKYKRP